MSRGGRSSTVAPPYGSPSSIDIIGGGPAGAMAAITALGHGSPVRVFEKSVFPRHKVCGEFLSPEIAAMLETVGLRDEFLGLDPPRLRRVRLHFGRRIKKWALADPAYGLSRYALDQMLLGAAIRRGANVVREAAAPRADAPTILAYGRRVAAEKGARLFGFKAHFRGSFDDGVDLVFFGRCYAGVSAVERDEVNICGLAPETVLRSHHFEPDSLIQDSPALRELTRGLTRSMDWLVTGPLVFRDAFRLQPDSPIYLAGDALGFVDPFTGSGILSAVLTGRLAGEAAAHRLQPQEHLQNCRRALRLQYRTAGLLRKAVESGWAEALAWLVPGRALFSATRPRIPA